MVSIGIKMMASLSNVKKGWWKVKFKHRNQDCTMYSCPWAYIITKRGSIEFGVF